jgi:hypothetical protein
VRRLLVVILAALLAAPAMAVAATGCAPSPSKQTLGEDAAPPSSARLQLEGSGVVRLEGRLVTFGLIPEGATLWVRDLAGDARFFLDGDSRRLRTGAMVRIRDASGRIYLSGSRVILQIRADDISLSTAGRGRASVSGDGAFTLNNERERIWPSRTRSPLRFAIEPPAPPADEGEEGA